MFLLAVILVVTTGCAIGDSRDSQGYSEPAEGSRQHPSSYFIDRFQVQKEIPKNRQSNVPFYFKKCSEVGERYPSRTSYDCDYPF